MRIIQRRSTLECQPRCAERNFLCAPYCSEYTERHYSYNRNILLPPPFPPVIGSGRNLHPSSTEGKSHILSLFLLSMKAKFKKIRIYHFIYFYRYQKHCPIDGRCLGTKRKLSTRVWLKVRYDELNNFYSPHTFE
jgi:hypothetical protein